MMKYSGVLPSICTGTSLFLFSIGTENSHRFTILALFRFPQIPPHLIFSIPSAKTKCVRRLEMARYRRWPRQFRRILQHILRFLIHISQNSKSAPTYVNNNTLSLLSNFLRHLFKSAFSNFLKVTSERRESGVLPIQFVISHEVRNDWSWNNVPNILGIVVF